MKRICFGEANHNGASDFLLMLVMGDDAIAMPLDHRDDVIRGLEAQPYR